MAGPFTPPGFAVPAFRHAVRLAVEAGLDAVAIIDARGLPLAVAGALDPDETRAVAALATREVTDPDLLDRLMRGDSLTTSIGEREAHIGIAARCVFFVVVLPRDRAAASLAAVDDLRVDIEDMVRDARSAVATSAVIPPPSSPGGSSSAPPSGPSS